MPVEHVLDVVDGDNLADLARIDQLLDLHARREVPGTELL